MTYEILMKKGVMIPASGGHTDMYGAKRPHIANFSPCELEAAARILREAVRDKTYQLCPMGEAAADYLRRKRKRLTPASYRAYESGLDKLARFFPDLKVSDFEPPAGTRRMEEFMDAEWGASSARTYNKNFSIFRDLFKFLALDGQLQGDPTLAMERAKTRDVHREVYAEGTMAAIVAGNPDLRDRLCLRLLLDYGLRKGTLRAVQFEHFDHERRRLTTFSKGAKVRQHPLPDPHFWMELEGYLLEAQASPTDFLLCRQRKRPVGPVRKGQPRAMLEYRILSEPMSSNGASLWWYRCLERAGIVAPGTTSGERMHKARHSAGQRVLEGSGGDLKLVQQFLGHEDISTTGNIYVDYDIAVRATKVAEALGF